MIVTCSIETPSVWRIGLAPSEEGGQTLIDGEGTARLSAILEEADSSSRCRVLVLEGQQGSFCQGMDLGLVSSSADGQLGPAAQSFARCLAGLHGGQQIVVAAIDGSAIGGGVGLAAAADIVLCSERSTFGLPELSLGLLPAIVLPVLLQRMPPQKARALALGGSVDAGRALELGLADRVVADEALLQKALRGIIKQALRCRPQSVAGLKWHLSQIQGLQLDRALELGAQRTAELLGDSYGISALQAFLEGDPLPWFESYKVRKK